MSAPLLEVRDLRKRFVVSSGGGLFSAAQEATVHAVEDVSLSIEAGEVLTIVGESGCGKSTIAKMLAGLVDPTSGTMTVDGHELLPRRTTADRRRIQLVTQNPWSALNRRRTLHHALVQPLQVNHIGKDRRERDAMVHATIERVGLSKDHLTARPGDVSGGELARAVLARALLLSPQVLVLDEPTASLDASVKATVVNLLMDLRAELDLAMLLITHEIGIARTVADRAAVMYLGRLVEIGAADTVLTEPTHPYTRMLLDSVPLADPVHRRLDVGRGEAASAMFPPAGCAYHPRCDLRDDRCRTELPASVEHHGLLVACHRVSEAAEAIETGPTDLGLPTARPTDQHPNDQPNDQEGPWIPTAQHSS